MKKKYYCILYASILLLLSVEYAQAQKTCESASLVTQADVDAFAKKGCTIVRGKLNIAGNRDISDLSPLSGLTEIDTLHIRNRLSGNLEGFEGLKKIGELSVNDTDLVSLNGLHNVREVKIAEVTNNPKIQSTKGLWRVRECEKLTLYDNKSLTELGLDSLKSVGELRVNHNSSLSDCCLFKNIQFGKRPIIYSNKKGGDCGSIDEIKNTCPNPVISDFSPSSGSVGTIVTLRGSSFQKTKGVRLGDKWADYTLIDDSTLEVTVPLLNPGLLYLTVINTAGSTTSGEPFTVTDGTAIPTIPATNLETGIMDSTSVTLRWTKGNGVRRLAVLKRADNPLDFLPQNGRTYTANPDLHEKDSITDNYLIYSGEEDFVTLHNLKPDTRYQASIYEFNTNSQGDTRYLLTGRTTVAFQTDRIGDCRGPFKLSSQADINAFSEKGCTTIKGRLYLGTKYDNIENDIHDLSPLSGLKSVYYLNISNADNLESLTGLEGLNSLKSLKVYSNYNLKTLEALKNVSQIENIDISYQSDLKSFKGLWRIKKLKKLEINSNSSIKNMEGFDNLKSVDSLEIESNGSLSTLEGLNSLKNVGKLTIHSNYSLAECCLLKNVTVTGNAYIIYNGRGCRNEEEIEEGCLPPLITGFSPEHGGQGTAVTLRGSSFLKTRAFQFNNRKASFTIINDSTLEATVPLGTAPGPLALSVFTTVGKTTSDQPFTVTDDGPVAPTTPSSHISPKITAPTSVTLRWTKGNGMHRLVVFKEADNPQDFLPQDGRTYKASPKLNEKDSTTNNYLIYSGEENFVTLHNLELDTRYQASVYEFNKDGQGNTRYLLEGRPTTIFRTDGPGDCRGKFKLQNQNQVRAFGKKGCTSVRGELAIGLGRKQSNIRNLRPLSGLKEVYYLRINDMKAESLEGLEGLNSIGKLAIEYNYGLNTLKGLDNVSQIGKVKIYTQYGLNSLKALWRIKELQNLSIKYVKDLNSLEGLESLESVGKLEIEENPSLETLEGLESLKRVRRLEIIDNRKLAQCCILKNVTVAGSFLSTDIRGNKKECNSRDEIERACPLPLITDLSPEQGGAGTVITLTGSLLLQTKVVKFGDSEARFTVINDSKLQATVPPGTALGPLALTVTTPGGSSTLGKTFTVTDLPTAPTVPPSQLEAESKIPASATLRWKNGNGLRRLVVLREYANPKTFYPRPDRTYAVSPKLNEKDSATGNYLVYAGNGHFITLTNLKPNTRYHVSIYEFNIDQRGHARYLINGSPRTTFQTGSLGECRGGFKLYSQDDVDAFGKQGCTTLKGKLTIGKPWWQNYNDIKDLSPLSGLRAIYHLRISNMDKESLEGMEGLNSIGKLEINGNHSLRTLEGMGSVSRIGQVEIIESHLRSLKGLRRIKELDSLTLQKNYYLRSLEGLSSLESVGNLKITDNRNLSDCCLLKGVTVTGNIDIRKNEDGCDSRDEIEEGCVLPLITDFSPKNGGVGTTVTLIGNLSEIRSVKFGGKEAIRFYLRNDSTLTAVVPPNLPESVHLSVQDYKGNEAHSQDLFHSKGEPAEPTRSARSLWAQASANDALLNWENGNGIRRLVVLKRTDNPRDFIPEDGKTYRTSSRLTEVDAATQNYLIYRNGGQSIRITGLEPSTKYTFRVFEYYADNQGRTNYLTSPYPEATFKTTRAVLSLSENPLQSTTDVRLYGAGEGATLHITSVYGRRAGIKHFKGGNITLNRAEMAPGAYILKAYKDGQLLATEKLMVK